MHSSNDPPARLSFSARGARSNAVVLFGVVAGCSLLAWSRWPVSAAALATSGPVLSLSGHEGGPPTVSVDAADLADPTLHARLESGLPQLLVTRVRAYASATAERAFAATTRSCRIVYDPWERRYDVEMRIGHVETRGVTTSLDRVTADCLGLDRVPVGVASDWSGRAAPDVVLSVVVELNPLSSATVRRMRVWLGDTVGAEAEPAFFGSFVSRFVDRRMGGAEQTFRFRPESPEESP